MKLTGAYFVEFPEGPPAVVVEYETFIPTTDMPALTAQADELIKVFQADIEATGASGAVLRASHFEGVGAMREGTGYGFLYSKNKAGAWVRDKKEGG